jgi:hypothetical protein
VDAHLLEVLRGKASQVAGAIRRSATLRGLTGAKRKAVDTCANYLLKYKQFLRYDEYLAAGLPIAPEWRRERAAMSPLTNYLAKRGVLAPEKSASEGVESRRPTTTCSACPSGDQALDIGASPAEAACLLALSQHPLRARKSNK